MSARPTIAELLLGDEPDAWRALGFAVSNDSVCQIGTVGLRLAGGGVGEGIVAWALRDGPTRDVDGLRTELRAEPRQPAASVDHPNGAVRLDHVVVTTGHLDRTFAALERAGFEQRRLRDAAGPSGPIRQGFYRMGEVILEVVGPADAAPSECSEPRPARFWGLVVIVADLDAAASLLGDGLGSVRDAVQPGRRIATVRSSAGLGPAVALMDE